MQQQIFHISKHDGSGSVVGLSQGSFSIQDDASGTPGCNAALDRTRGVYHKTAIRLSTYEPGNCTDTCPSGSTCCKDPSAKVAPMHSRQYLSIMELVGGRWLVFLCAIMRPNP